MSKKSNLRNARQLDNAVYSGSDEKVEFDLSGLDGTIGLDDLTTDAERPQPRRLIPINIARANPDADRDEILAKWQAEVEVRVGESLNIAGIITAPQDHPLPNIPQIQVAGKLVDDPLVERFYDLVADLAYKIHDHGLDNAITVTDQDGQFVIDTGERRWSAFHLLRKYVDAEKYARIPVETKPDRNAFRVVGENTGRRDLIPTELAASWALLAMESHRQAGAEVEFQPATDFDSVWAFYRQAREHGVAYGYGAKVASGMGDLARQTINKYAQLLDLPDEILDQAHEEAWNLNYALQFVDEVKGTSYSRSNDDNKGNVSHERQSPELIPLGSRIKIWTGRADEGAKHRGIELAQALIEAGRWDGDGEIWFDDAYAVHTAIFTTVDDTTINDLVIERHNGQLIIALPAQDAPESFVVRGALVRTGRRVLGLITRVSDDKAWFKTALHHDKTYIRNFRKHELTVDSFEALNVALDKIGVDVNERNWFYDEFADIAPRPDTPATLQEADDMIFGDGDEDGDNADVDDAHGNPGDDGDITKLGFGIGDRVTVQGRGPGEITQVISSNLVRVQLKNGPEMTFQENLLTPLKSKAEPARITLRPGDLVETRTGRLGVFLSAAGIPTVITTNSETMHREKTLTPVTPFTDAETLLADLRAAEWAPERIALAFEGLNLEMPRRKFSARPHAVTNTSQVFWRMAAHNIRTFTPVEQHDDIQTASAFFTTPSDHLFAEMIRNGTSPDDLTELCNGVFQSLDDGYQNMKDQIVDDYRQRLLDRYQAIYEQINEEES